MIATILWESSFFAQWHTSNPADSLLSWLGSRIEVRRIFLLSLGVWSLSSLVYIFMELRCITIYSAVYFTDKAKKDVTEIVRSRVSNEQLRVIPATNTFLGGDIDPGETKKFTIDYSVWGKRRTQTVYEDAHVKLR